MANDNDAAGAQRPPPLDAMKGWYRNTRDRLPLDQLRDRLDHIRERVEPAVSGSLKTSWQSMQSGWQRLIAARETKPAHETPPARANEMREAARAYRTAFIGLGVASGLVNLLTLT